MGCFLENDHYIFACFSGIVLNNQDVKLAIRKYLEEHPKIKLVVIDTLRRCHTLRENESDDMNELFQQLQAYCADFDVSFLLLHHERKSGFNSQNDYGIDTMRGSSVIGDVASNVIRLVKPARSNDRVVLNITKIRDAAIPEPRLIKVIWNDTDIILEDLGNTEEMLSNVDECAKAIRVWITEEGSEKKTNDIHKHFKTDYKQRCIGSALKLLQDTKQINKVKRGVYAPIVEVDTSINDYS